MLVYGKGQFFLPHQDSEKDDAMVGTLVVSPMSLRLAWGSGSEAVDLEASGDADDAGSIFAGGEVAGLLGGAGTGPEGAGKVEGNRVETVAQEAGHGPVAVTGAETPTLTGPSRPPGGAG